MTSSAVLQPDPAPIVACTVSRDVQNFDMLIEDMEAILGETWGDLTFEDAAVFLKQPEARSLQFIAVAMDSHDGITLIFMYITTVAFPEFIAPYHPTTSNEDYVSMAPQLPRFFDEEGNFHLRPFVYGTTVSLNTEDLIWVHETDYSTMYPVEFFVNGVPYKLFGLIPTDIHLFGVEEPGTLFLFGSDHLGRGVFSRTLYGGRVSLTIGLVGVALTLIIGSSMGTISGYYGGVTDVIMQRLIEILQAFPTIPLWAALAVALPPDWPPIQRFFGISIILSFIGWTGLGSSGAGQSVGLS